MMGYPLSESILDQKIATSLLWKSYPLTVSTRAIIEKSCIQGRSGSLPSVTRDLNGRVKIAGIWSSHPRVRISTALKLVIVN